jgi:hypothetical protein
MFKKSVSIIVLASFLSFIGYSCADDKLTPPEGVSRTENDLLRLEEQLGRAPEVRELLQIRDDIISRAIDRGITSRQLRETISDTHRWNDLLGFSSEEASDLDRRMQTLIETLCDRHPELERLVARSASEPACVGCDTERLAASWDAQARAITAARAADEDASSAAGRQWGAGGSLAPSRAPLACKWTQLTVGLAMCAIRSGGSFLFYALCSYGVFCGSCDGGMADVLCG